MALLENPSLETRSLDGEQDSLSKAQKAALVLAASEFIFDSFIFFPNLRNFRTTLINWVKIW